MRRKNRFLILFLLFSTLCLLTGCGEQDIILENEYKYLIGVSLSNVVEPWLSHMTDSITACRQSDRRVNIIFKDAAGSADKQIQDIDQLMECGVDLLIVAPVDSVSLKEKIDEVYEEIAVVALGIDPGTENYTSFIEFNDYEIGKIAGNYILERQYKPESEIVVLEGLPDSAISQKRLQGFQEAVKEKINERQIHYLNGEWLRDKAENRMKDYLIINQRVDIVVAFNDEMAYGAYLALSQYRVTGTSFIGVDGFTGNMGGLDLVKRGILTATIQCSEIGEQAYQTAICILDGGKPEKHILIEPVLITERDL